MARGSRPPTVTRQTLVLGAPRLAHAQRTVLDAVAWDAVARVCRFRTSSLKNCHGSAVHYTVWSTKHVIDDADTTNTASLLRSLGGVRRWSSPLQFPAADPTARGQLARLIRDGRVAAVVDPLAEFADELYHCRNANEINDRQAPEVYGQRFLSAADTFGVWVFFPWSGELIRYPDMQEHRRLRTLRNRDLITVSEQRALAEARIAVFGLSVGSNVVDQFVQIGIGGSYLIGDTDRVSPSNLNRIRATMRHVGMAKIDVLACKISEADPFIEQIHLADGYTSDATDHLLEFRPSLIVEEVDDLVTKARIRRWASESRTPLLMVGDIGERSVIDVERHDLGHVRPFNGRVNEATFAKLVDGQLTPAEERRLLVNIAGPKNLTVRLITSALRVGSDLAGMPQLGSAASAGAAVASVAARAIIGQEALKSGAYVLSPRRMLRLGRQSGFRDAVRSARALRQEFRAR